MRWIHFGIFVFALIFGGCAGELSPEKAIIGTWVQETPTSMTSRGIQTTTINTVLKFQKNGETHLTRNLTIEGQKLPAEGIELRVELRGTWDITNTGLTQTQTSALIMPQDSSKLAQDWSRQADAGHKSVKTIVLANKEQLILQDQDTGTTDTYRRK